MLLSLSSLYGNKKERSKL